MIPRYAEIPYDLCEIYGHILKESPCYPGTFYCVQCDLIEVLNPRNPQ